MPSLGHSLNDIVLFRREITSLNDQLPKFAGASDKQHCFYVNAAAPCLQDGNEEQRKARFGRFIAANVGGKGTAEQGEALMVRTEQNVYALYVLFVGIFERYVHSVPLLEARLYLKRCRHLHLPMGVLLGSQDYDAHQLEVKTAFLNGDLESEVYMKCQPGFEVPGKVWKLEKALYGLRQAAEA